MRLPYIPTLIDAGRAWFAEDAPNLIFALKTSVAGLLALWISFRLEFTQPQWAVLTVFIVARKESGLVMTKSFYRIVGTIAGCTFSVVLAALFSQSAELFLLVLALWIGLCVGLAARYRNFQSYGFMLAGYTAAIVGFGAATSPQHAFDIAQSRVSEVMVGILCAGVIAEAFFPSHASTRLIPDALVRLERFTDFMAQAFALDMDSRRMQQIQQDFLTDIMASENQRSASFLESPVARRRDARLRWMNASFMKISTTFHGFIQAMRRFRANASGATVAVVTCHYQALVTCLAGHGCAADRQPSTIAQRLAIYRATLPQQSSQIEPLVISIENATERRDAAAILGLYIRTVGELSDYIDAVAALSETKPVGSQFIPGFTVHGDSWIAILSGLRSIAVLFVLSGFWIATAWPGGSTAVILGAVFCILFGTMPSPLVVLKQVTAGFAFGQLMAYVCLFMVWPATDSFASMALGLLPFLIFCAWLIETRRFSVEASGVFIGFLAGIAPHNQMHYDMVTFVNDGISSFVGLGAAGVAFAVLPASAARLRKRLFASLGRQAAQACLAPLDNGRLRHHFESRTRDLLYQLSTPPANVDGKSEDAIGHAMAILEIGQIVIEMRLSLSVMRQQNSLKVPMHRLLRALAALCQQPCAALRVPVAESLDLLDSALDQLLITDDAERSQRAQLQLGQYQIRAILRDEDWFRLVRYNGSVSHLSTGVSHAT